MKEDEYLAAAEKFRNTIKRRTAYHNTPRSQDPTGLAYEALRKAWQNREQCRAETESGRVAWIATIHANLVCDVLEKRAKRPQRTDSATLEGQPDSQPLPEEQIQQQERHKKLIEALLRLQQESPNIESSPSDAQMLALYYFGDDEGQPLGVQEVANLLEMNEEQAKKRIQRARDRLRKLL